MKRSYSLKIVSILMLLAGGARFVFGIMMFSFFTTSANLKTVPPDLLRCAIIAAVLILLFVIATAVCGILGALCWDDPSAALKCMFLGIGTLALGLAGDLLQSHAGYQISIPVWILSVGIPALYILAALIFRIGSRRSRKKAVK